MKSFEPGQLIHNGSSPIPVLVLTVTLPAPSCGEGAFITVLPLGENKLLGPIFAVPSHWDLLPKDPR
jgi:hypothetical protein